MTPEAYKATEAVEFIAEHLRNEDEYIQVQNEYLNIYFIHMYLFIKYCGLQFK